MAALTKEQILRAKPRTIAVPWLGDEILIRHFRTCDLSRFLRERKEVSGIDSLTMMVKYSVCDESGKLLFIDDEEGLQSLDYDLVKLLADEAMKLNDLNPKSQVKAGEGQAVEDTAPGPSRTPRPRPSRTPRPRPSKAV